MSERMKHEPNNYSSQEVVERAKSVLTHVKDELAGLFTSELTGDWYHWLLRVDLDASDPYKAIVAHEVEGKLSYTFESLRLGTPGEILYRGCTIDEDHPELYSELVSEAKRQYDWAKRRQERQAEMRQKAELSDAALKLLREEYPQHARGILVHSQQKCTFNLTLTGLTPDRLREIIRISELGVVWVDPGKEQPMSDKTLTIGTLVLTKDGSGYKYEVAGSEGIRLRFYPGWKHDVAMATVQFPKDCNSVNAQSAGSYRTSIEGALSYMRQEIEQEVRLANKKLADFNTQSAEILAAIGEPDAQVDQPSTETP